MVVAINATGMSTFGRTNAFLKNVNAIAHYTDWIIAHGYGVVHIGGLG